MLPAIDKRKFIRHNFPVRAAINYIAGHSEGETHKGFIANKSLSGLCIFTFDPLYIGENINLKRNHYVPFQKAEVKWIKEVNKQWYAVGLSGKN